MIILASQSPRRKELLQMAGVDFVCVPSDAEEVVPEGTSAEDMPFFLSKLKARDIAKRYPEDMVVGSDTLVIVDGKPLGKPKTKEDAFQMLRTLSGRTHMVVTGVTICQGQKEESFSSKTEVEFYPLEDQEIRNYIETGEPMDKAGAYGIQGKGCVLVKEIRGDYYTVMGLPVAETVRRLKDF